MQPNQSYPPPEPASNGPANPGPAAPGPAAPRSRGRRRAGRTLFASAAAGLLAVAVIAAGTALASAGAHRGHRATPTALSHPRAAKQASTAARRKQALAKRAAGEPVHPAPPRAYGAVISAGIRNSAGELVFYAVRVHVSQLPGTTFGIMGGYRAASGKLTGDVESNEFSGPDTAPGFHAVEAPMTASGQAIPEFGYYAGPAAKITGVVGGRRILADHAQWSVNPKIVIFWFSPSANHSAQPVSGLAAYNAHGKRLPAGHNSAGVG